MCVGRAMSVSVGCKTNLLTMEKKITLEQQEVVRLDLEILSLAHEIMQNWVKYFIYCTANSTDLCQMNLQTCFVPCFNSLVLSLPYVVGHYLVLDPVAHQGCEDWNERVGVLLLRYLFTAEQTGTMHVLCSRLNLVTSSNN